MALELQVKVHSRQASDQIRRFANQSGEQVKKMESRWKGLGSTIKSSLGLLGAGIVFHKSINGIRAMVTAHNIQEKALARLEANVKNVLISFKGYDEQSEKTRIEIVRQTQALREQAHALQQVTTFGDERIISAQAMLSTFALEADAIAKVTPRLLDMAAASEKATGSQVDLEQIAIAIGKSLTIGVGSLTRYGVVISDNAKKQFELASESEKLNIILGELDKNFRGVAEAVGETDAAELDKLANAFGDLKEKGGGVALGIINPMARELRGLVEAISDLENTTAFKGLTAIHENIVEPIAQDIERLQGRYDALAASRTKSLKEQQDIAIEILKQYGDFEDDVTPKIEKREDAEKTIVDDIVKQNRLLRGQLNFQERVNEKVEFLAVSDKGLAGVAAQWGGISEWIKDTNVGLAEQTEWVANLSSIAAERVDQEQQAIELAEKQARSFQQGAFWVNQLSNAFQQSLLHSKGVLNIAQQIATTLAFRAGTAGLLSLLPGAPAFSKLFYGFEHGGSFTVGGSGGPDSQLVAFRATPGERVDVTPQQQVTNNNQRADIHLHTTEPLEDEFYWQTRVMPRIRRDLGM